MPHTYNRSHPSCLMQMSAKQSRIEKLKLEIRKVEAERDGLKQVSQRKSIDDKFSPFAPPASVSAQIIPAPTTTKRWAHAVTWIPLFPLLCVPMKAAESQAKLFKDGYAELRACLKEMRTQTPALPSTAYGPGISSFEAPARQAEVSSPKNKRVHVPMRFAHLQPIYPKDIFLHLERYLIVALVHMRSAPHGSYVCRQALFLVADSSPLISPAGTFLARVWREAGGGSKWREQTGLGAGHAGHRRRAQSPGTFSTRYDGPGQGLALLHSEKVCAPPRACSRLSH